ncbi:hypothetical protein C8R46DRAFT_1106739, partial [Mycena filopes]
MDAVEGVLSRAFTGDLFTAVVTGHALDDPDTAYIGPFWKSTVVAGLLGGEVYVAETVDTKKIIGCAVWFGPGHTMYDTPEQQQHSLGPLMGSFDKDLQAWWMTTTLGVDPEYQRQGAGRLLVNAIVEKAAPTKTALCVECATETNVRACADPF